MKTLTPKALRALNRLLRAAPQMALAAYGLGLLLGCNGFASGFKTIPDTTTESVLSGQQEGVLTPTIYYFPTYKRDLSQCGGEPKELRSPTGKLLTTLCQSQFTQCYQQGQCKITEGDGSIVLALHSEPTSNSSSTKSSITFDEIDLKDCPFGFGTREDICLDPYHSVAADLSFYRVGDVIYLPAAAGIKLLDGGVHDGYFIVRDTGGAIRGLGRFDFFIGGDNLLDAKNPFVKLGLDDKKTPLSFQVIRGEVAENIRKNRLYPSVHH